MILSSPRRRMVDGRALDVQPEHVNRPVRAVEKL